VIQWGGSLAALAAAEGSQRARILKGHGKMPVAYLLSGTVAGYFAGSLVWWISGSLGSSLTADLLCGCGAVIVLAKA
jgi:hypothetical protein